jgi:hypothetical protein
VWPYTRPTHTPLITNTHAPLVIGAASHEAQASPPNTPHDIWLPVARPALKIVTGHYVAPAGTIARVTSSAARAHEAARACSARSTVGAGPAERACNASSIAGGGLRSAPAERACGARLRSAPAERACGAFTEGNSRGDLDSPRPLFLDHCHLACNIFLPGARALAMVVACLAPFGNYKAQCTHVPQSSTCLFRNQINCFECHPLVSLTCRTLRMFIIGQCFYFCV